jgi:hypothetical protein
MTEDLPPLETGLTPVSKAPAPAGFFESAAAAWEADTVRTDVNGHSLGIRRNLTMQMYKMLSPEGQRRVQGRNAQVDPLVRDHVYLEDFVMEEFATERPPVGDFPTTREDFTARINAERMREMEDAEAVTARGNWLGSFTGSMARAISDPINIALMPFGIGGGAARVIASEMVLGGLGEALSLPRENEVATELGIEQPDAMTRIGVGALAGGVLGGALYGLGHLAVRAAERAAYPKGVPATQVDAAIAREEGYMRGDLTPDEMLGTAPGATGGQAAPIEQQIIAGLVSRGLSLPVARGITANMIAESGLNPGINEIAPLVSGSRGGYGLNQWTGPRRRQLEAFAEQQGRPINDLDLQLDFTLWELGNTERAAMDALSGVNDPVEAARIYSERFLRPGIPHMGRRLAEARRLAGMGAPEGVTPYVPTSRGYTGTGQVNAGDEFRIDVDYKVVDMASLTRASGDLQPRDRSRINSDEWIAATAARLDPARLMPNPDASTGTPIIGPDGIIESGNGRVAAIDRAYSEFPDRGNAYRAQIEDAGFPIPEGMERPVLVAERKTPLDDVRRQEMVVAAQDSGVAQMTPTEIARTGARRMDAPVLARLNPDLPINHADNADFVTRVMAGLSRSDRNAMVDKTGALNTPGQRRLREAIFARAWPDDDILSRFTETAPDELKSLVDALDAAAPDWAVLRGDIEAGLVRADMDIGPYVLDAMRMIAAAREASAQGGPTIAGALEDLLNQIDLLDGAVSPLTTALVRQFWKNGRAAPAKDIAAFLKRYAKDARVAGRTGQMFDATGPAEVLRKIDPAAFGDLPDDLGRTRTRAQEPLPQVELPEAGLDEGALSADAIEADAAAADDLLAGAPPTAEMLAEIAPPRFVPTLAAAQPFDDFDTLYTKAAQAQDRLEAVGADIAADLGVTFKNPGLKDRAEAEAKVVRKRYNGPRSLTDISRAGFVVNELDEAEQVIARLAETFDLIDEGWVQNSLGYIDRKVILRHPDGMLSEVQLWTTDMWDAKKKGTPLYKAARKLPEDNPERVHLDQEQRVIYSAAKGVLSDVAFSADGKSMVPKLVPNQSSRFSADPRTRAVWATSSASTGSQSPPGVSSASAKKSPEGLRNSTAGRASQSVKASSFIGNVPPSLGDTSNMAAVAAEVNAAPARLVASDPALDAAFAAYPIEMPDGSRRTAAEVLADLDADAQFDAFIQGCAIVPQGAPE